VPHRGRLVWCILYYHRPLINPSRATVLRLHPCGAGLILFLHVCSPWFWFVPYLRRVRGLCYGVWCSRGWLYSVASLWSRPHGSPDRLDLVHCPLVRCIGLGGLCRWRQWGSGVALGGTAIAVSLGAGGGRPGPAASSLPWSGPRLGAVSHNLMASSAVALLVLPNQGPALKTQISRSRPGNRQARLHRRCCAGSHGKLPYRFARKPRGPCPRQVHHDQPVTQETVTGQSQIADFSNKLSETRRSRAWCAGQAAGLRPPKQGRRCNADQPTRTQSASTGGGALTGGGVVRRRPKSDPETRQGSAGEPDLPPPLSGS